MDAAELPDRSPSSSERPLGLEPVRRDVLRRPFRGLDLWRVREEIGRTVEEVMLRVAPERGAPWIELVEPATGVAISDVGPGFELARGRGGTRIVRTGPGPVSRAGWPLREREPSLVLPEDEIVTEGRSFRARATAPMPRRLAEIGECAWCQAPTTDGVEMAFRLEPIGGWFRLALDGGLSRAVLDCVLAGDGERPYDPTKLPDVDAAVISWVMRRVVHSTLRALFGAEIAAVEAPPSPAEGEVWCAAVTRVGAYTGVAYVGLDGAAVSALGPRLPKRATRTLGARSALCAITTTVSLRIALGRIDLGPLAALAPGDLLVARDGDAWIDRGLRGNGNIVVGRGGRPVAVRLEQAGPTVRARLVGSSA